MKSFLTSNDPFNELSGFFIWHIDMIPEQKPGV